MSKGRFEQQGRTRSPLRTLAAVLIVLVFAVLLFYNCSHTPTDVNDPTVPEATVKKNDGSISIPGFEMLELKADSKQQTIALSNPAQNNCYFEISLYLEDGTLLWRSELIEPGEVSEPLVLTMELPKGYYPESILRYHCYRMDEDRTPLNGAETKVTLWVK